MPRVCSLVLDLVHIRIICKVSKFQCVPRKFSQNLWEWGPGISILFRAAGDSDMQLRVPCVVLVYLMTLWSVCSFPYFMDGNTEDRIDQPSISGDSNPVCLIPETVLSIHIS